MGPDVAVGTTVTPPSRQHPFSRREWFETWWKYAAGADLRPISIPVIAMSAVGTVELGYRPGEGSMLLAGDAEVTDYSAPCGNASSSAAARVLVDWLVAADVPWRRFEARNLRPGDRFGEELVRAAAGAGLAPVVSEDEQTVVLDLPASWDDYLRSLGRHGRHEILRKRRRFAERVPSAALRYADSATVESDVDAFVRLHRGSRGEKGAFMTVHRAAFFRDLATRFLARGELCLAMLDVDDRAIASVFGFEIDSVLYVYNASYDLRLAAIAPGFELTRRVIEDAIVRGVTTVDFMRGTERFKFDFGGVMVPLTQVRIAVPA
jgi:CelD/BcsL family acetyltransferase involved in cellulose biosynthesis